MLLKSQHNLDRSFEVSDIKPIFNDLVNIKSVRPDPSQDYSYVQFVYFKNFYSKIYH